MLNQTYYKTPRLFHKVLSNKCPQNKRRQTKYLGLIIDEHLSFKTHIESVKQKITQAAGLLAELRHCVPLRILKLFHFTLFNSHMRYC